MPKGRELRHNRHRIGTGTGGNPERHIVELTTLQQAADLAATGGQFRFGLEELRDLAQATGEGDVSEQELQELLRSTDDNQGPALGVIRGAGQQILDDITAEHTASVQAQETARTRWDEQQDHEHGPEDPEPYTAFQQDYAAARARAAAGEQVIPYLTEDATGGLGARDGGRSFGLEIEFDFPENMDHYARQTALANIARDMHRAGMAQDSFMHGYHAAAQAGYTDAPNAWRLEEDCTVAGEVVSPILYDEPHTWQNLAQICDIVRRHGGIASARTGGHIHVGTGDFDHSVENHNRLMNTVAAHEDVLYRLAQNPDRPHHRGTDWCSPNYVPTNGYESIERARYGNAGHGYGVNLQSVFGRASDHAEYRMWDGTLNPSVIQAQINVSLGITNSALRNAGSPTPPNEGRRDRLGSHRDLYQGRRLSGEQWRQSTESFRRLVDTIFQRPAHRAQAAALYSLTHWQRRR